MQEFESSPFQIVRSRDALASPESQVAAARVFIIEESLGYLVNYLAKLFSQILTASLAPHGVYPGQWGVRLFFWVQVGQTHRESSRQVAMVKQSMFGSTTPMNATVLF